MDSYCSLRVQALPTRPPTMRLRFQAQKHTCTETYCQNSLERSKTIAQRGARTRDNQIALLKSLMLYRTIDMRVRFGWRFGKK